MSSPAYEHGRALERGTSASDEENTVEVPEMQNTNPEETQTPLRDPNLLAEHDAAGHELIAVNGMKTAFTGWRQSAPLSLEDAQARMAKGSNIGVRPQATNLVIAVDPRHFSDNDDPPARLEAAFNLPEAPFVKMGGGGLQLYLKKPADLPVKDALEGYQGIEFQSSGRLVVAAGSVHPITKRL